MMDNPIRNFIAEGPTDHGGDSDIIWKLRVKSNLILKLTYKIIFFINLHLDHLTIDMRLFLSQQTYSIASYF
jgi:hypothetical protein